MTVQVKWDVTALTTHLDKTNHIGYVVLAW